MGLITATGGLIHVAVNVVHRGIVPGIIPVGTGVFVKTSHLALQGCHFGLAGIYEPLDLLQIKASGGRSIDTIVYSMAAVGTVFAAKMARINVV
jgi:hypothetical protein